MGSAFTAGSIMQHIAKLRLTLEELNVVPVPAPPRRGQITRKPSSVYTQKSRVGRPLLRPAISKPKSRQTGRAAQSNNADGATTKSRPKRRPTGRQIKRSSSDPANSEDEFEGHVDSNNFGRELNANGKRPHRRRSRTATAASQADSVRERGRSYTRSIMEKLAEADARFEAEHGNDPDYLYAQDQPVFSTPGSIENDQMQATLTQTFNPYPVSFPGYAETLSEEEEEVEETSALPGLQKPNTGHPSGGSSFGFNYNYPLPHTEDQISPTATVSYVS